MSLLTNRRTILAKLETTYGTDAVPTGAANAMLIRNLTVTPLDASTVSLDRIRPYLGNSPTLLTETSVKLDFEVELAGSGSAGVAPKWAALLKACGFSETIVATTSVAYTPISVTFPSLTFYYNVDGVLHVATGARGTVELTIDVKAVPILHFVFTGLYTPPSDTASPTVDFSGFQLPLIPNTTNTPSFSLQGYAGILQTMNLNMTNDIELRTLIGAQSVNLVNRKPAGSFLIEAPTIAAKDFFEIARAGTLGDMTITHGIVAGNIVTIDCPSVSLQNPAYSDSQGIQMLTIPYTAIPVTGNDEVTITLT